MKFKAKPKFNKQLNFIHFLQMWQRYDALVKITAWLNESCCE